MKLIRIQLGIDIKLICFLREREREREREICLSTVRHRPHFDNQDQYNQVIQNMMDNITEI